MYPRRVFNISKYQQMAHAQFVQAALPGRPDNAAMPDIARLSSHLRSAPDIC